MPLINHESTSIYIPGIDAKNIYLASTLNSGGTENFFPFSRKGRINKDRLNKSSEKRFKNALDFSIDQVKLTEVYKKVYRRSDFYTTINRKRYSVQVITVTFKYAVNEWNKVGKNVYIKLGYYRGDLTFSDGLAFANGELVGVELNREVVSPRLDIETMCDYFTVCNGEYILNEDKPMKKLKSTLDLRNDLYENGFTLGGVKYIRWKRSSGSARVGKCLFINEDLYPRMHKYDLCGIKVKQGDNCDLAALESYTSLTSSSIIDTLTVPLDSILIIDDFTSVFTNNVVSVEERNGFLTAEKKTCEIKNSIWDGQGLIESSAMGKYADKGMILLRNRFFKCCCFNTNIQKFFAENNITSISQLKGKTRATDISQIKLITTPSSVKYLKFGTLDEWLDNVEPTFGVVKHDKKTHFFDGELVRTHYQLLNTLQMTREEVDSFLKESFDYITLLKTSPAVVRYHIKYPDSTPFSESPCLSKNDIVYKLLGVTDKFAGTRYYTDFAKAIIKKQITDLKRGKVLVRGNYSTLLGNPLEMLYATIGLFTGEGLLGVGNVSCSRFPENTTILASRSPHVSMSNVLLAKNVQDSRIQAYFNLSDEIVCINSIGENVLQQLAGCDFDSDTVLLTDNPMLISAAQKNYGKFPVAVNNVISTKKKRRYLAEEQADLDIRTSRNLIGEIINLSQELNTKIWQTLNNGGSMLDVEPIYLDVCKLSIASGIEIDKAKKEFNVDTAKELAILSRKYNVKTEDGRVVKPKFFAVKDKLKGFYDPNKKYYKQHDTTMDYLQHAVGSYTYRTRNIAPSGNLSLMSIIDKSKYDTGYAYKVQANRILTTLQSFVDKKSDLYADESLSDGERHIIISRTNSDIVDFIGSLRVSDDTMVYTLTRLENSGNLPLYTSIINLLFSTASSPFYSIISSASESVPLLEESHDGDMFLYGIPHKTYKKSPKTSTF